MSDELDTRWGDAPDANTLFRLYLRDPYGRWDATVRSDGCVEMNQYDGPYPVETDRGMYETEHDNYERIHICDLDEYIKRLQSLQLHAKVYFNAEWGT